MTQRFRNNRRRWKLVWTDAIMNATIVGTGQFNQNLLSQFLGDYGTEATDYTVIRIIGRLKLGKTASNALSAVHIGIIAVTDQAFAAGAASMPDPSADREADWLYKDSIPLSNLLTGDASGQGAVSFEIDNHSKRVLRGANKSLAMLFEGSVAGQTVTVQGIVRTLLMAP